MAMARKKGGNGIGGVVVILAFLGWLISSIPREVWIGGAIVLAIALVLYLIGKNAQSKPKEVLPPEPVVRAATGKRGTLKPAPQVPSVTVTLGGEEFGYFPDADVDEPLPERVRSIRPIPPSPTASSPSTGGATSNGLRWVPAGESTTVAGITVSGGMLYVGSAQRGVSEPSLIDLGLSVARSGDYALSRMGYWPSYSSIAPTERRAYLNWLASGRKDPSADIGYVFLFFYGLERRAVVESRQSGVARAELGAIANEVGRLLGIYGSKSGSFRGYASSLLDWIALLDQPDKLYAKAVPDLPSSYELPLYLRLALGQCAVDAVPVPAGLALAWARLEPNISLRTPATRCAQEFEKLFVAKYVEKHGAGIVLKRNRTKLKLGYRPASAGLHIHAELALTVDGIPDVTALTAPVKQLDAVVEESTKELDSFSRFIGKNPELRSSLEAYLLLPPALWPESAHKTLQALAWRAQEKPVVLSFEKLMQEWGTGVVLNKDKVISLARALETSNVGLEPDILGGARMPKPEDCVVLFFHEGPEKLPRGEGAYQAACLTLQLASAVATADGEFGAEELEHLSATVASWQHLTSAQVKRLQAQLVLLQVEPVTLASLKKKIEPLDQSARETIAMFLATVAQADGEVSPAEVKMLEKVYKAFGVDPAKVFTDVHAVAAGVKTSAATIAKVEDTGFKLDTARIAELQKDTDKVSALLSNIFTEAEDAVACGQLVEEDASSEPAVPTTHPSNGLMGLDDAHATLARLLLSRAEWTRDELSDAAADLDLMLDGALEAINEAAFDTYDLALVEGEDPFTVNTEILEKIAA